MARRTGPVTPMKTSGTIIIVGGGVVGSSIAYHLRRDGHDGPLLVVERDPTYARASSSLAMAELGEPNSTSSPLEPRKKVNWLFHTSSSPMYWANTG